MKKQTTFFLFHLFFLSQTIGQDGLLFLENPSFDYPSSPHTVSGEMPPGFADCGFRPYLKEGQKPPFRFRADHPPSEGESYLGLLVHADWTQGRASVKLSNPMKAGQQYAFHLDLSRARDFSVPEGSSSKFGKACKLRIWGSHSPCGRAELLTESAPVTHHYWQDYAFVISPSERYSHLTFEAFYETSYPFPYNGNILIDRASPLRPLPPMGAGEAKRANSLLHQFVFTDTIFGKAAQITFYTRNDTSAAQTAQAILGRGHEVESNLKKGLTTMKAAGWGRFTPNQDFRDILLFALSANRDTKGFFDIGRRQNLKHQWVNSIKQLGRAPNRPEIKSQLDRSGIRRVGMKKDSIFWVKDLDLNLEWNELAEAHAVDEMAKLFSQKGHLMYAVRLGDNARSSMEEQIYERPFFTPDTLLTEALPIGHSAVASSRAGELLFEFEGEKFYDFTVPMRGRLVNERRLVTVEAKDCKTAFAWSQAFVASMSEEVLSAARPHVLRKWVSVE